MGIKESTLPRARSANFVPPEYQKIAKGMEQQFLRFMLEQMDKTIDRNGPDSPADSYYRSLLQDKRAEIMSEKDKGIGLQKLILDQIYPESMRTEMNYRAHLNRAKLEQKKAFQAILKHGAGPGPGPGQGQRKD